MLVFRYVGLTLTHASDFQMLRGSVVIFTGLLSVVWLGKKLKGTHWGGMILVLCGLLLVGLSGYLDKNAAAKEMVKGREGTRVPNPPPVERLVDESSSDDELIVEFSTSSTMLQR